MQNAFDIAAQDYSQNVFDEAEKSMSGNVFDEAQKAPDVAWAEEDIQKTLQARTEMAGDPSKVGMLEEIDRTLAANQFPMDRVQKTGYGNRADGTPKGKGFLGELPRPDGGVSTEISIGVRINGKETEIPLLVPTLEKTEIDSLLAGEKATDEMVQKAVDHANMRIKQGKSPFAQEGEQQSSKKVTKSFVTEDQVKEDYGMEDAEISPITKARDSIIGNLGAAAVEVPLALGTGAAAYFPSALAGSLAPIFGEDPDEWEQKVADYLTYHPKLKESKDAMKPINAVMEMAFKGAEVAGDKVTEATGDKNLGYAAKKGTEALIMATIGKVVGKAKEMRAEKPVKPQVSRQTLEAERKQTLIDEFPKRERPLEKLAAIEKEMYEEKFKAKENVPKTPLYEPPKGTVRAQPGTAQAKIIPETKFGDVIPKDRAKQVPLYLKEEPLTPQQKSLLDWQKEEQFKPTENKPTRPIYTPPQGTVRAQPTTGVPIIERPKPELKVAKKGEAAGGLTEDTRINGVTFRQLEDIIINDKPGIKAELEAIKTEHGREGMQDLVNPGKLYARLRKRLEVEEGMPKDQAKAVLQEPFKRYEQRFKEVESIETKTTGRNPLDIIKDINDSLGETGAVGAVKKTPKQEAATARLNADLEKINSGKKMPGRVVNGVMRPFVYTNAANITKDAPELKRRMIPEKGGGGGYVETPLRVFDELGPEMKELYYWQEKEASYKIAKDLKEIHDPKIKEMFKGTTASERARVALYGISKQKKGGEIIKNMGFEVPLLTPKELALYNNVRNWFDQWHPILVETAKKSGTKIGKVDNYIPYMHKESILSKYGYDSFNADVAKMDALYNTHVRTVPYRFAKAREKTGAYPVELDLLKIVSDYANISTKHQHLSPVIAQLKETIRASGIEATKPRTAAFLHNWLEFNANPILKSNFPRPIAKALMTLNQNAMFAVLSGSLRSGAIQISAIRGPLVEAGLKHTMEAIRLNLVEDVKAAKAHGATAAMRKSKVLLPRTYDNLQYDFMNAVRGGKLGELNKSAAMAGLKPLQLLDMETAKITWYASYLKATKDMKLPEHKAIRYADDQVIRTQASGSPADAAPIMRTVEGKTIGFLQTFAINEYQWVKKDILGIGNKDMPMSKGLPKLAKYLVATSLISSFYEDILNVNSPFPAPIHAFRDAKEQGKTDEEAYKEVAKEMVGAFPFLSALRYGTAPLGTPGLLSKQIIEGKPVELGATALGIPGTSQVKKSVRAYQRGGTPYEVVMGTYLPEKKKSVKRKKIKGGLGGL